MAKSDLLVGLSYALCVLSGISVLLSVAMAIFVVTHKQLAKRGSMKYVRHGTLLMILANVIANIGIILMMLWNGTREILYCEAGGFLFLFGVLESNWILLICAICLTIQMKTRLAGQNPFARLRERWNVPIFLLSILLKAVVLAMFTFLALTKVGFFAAKRSGCRMLLTLGTDSWQYSAMIVGVAWIALVPATALSVSNVFMNGSRRNPFCKSPKLVGTPGKFCRWLAIVNLMNALLSSIVLMVATVVVFAGEGGFDRNYVNIGLGYGVTLAAIASTLVAIVVLVFSNRWHHCDLSEIADREGLLCADPPHSLVSLTKLPHQQDDINCYLVHWFGNQRTLYSGVMKVYQPANISRWRAEVNAVAKVTTANHPNLARYLWESSKNNFAPQICRFTGDLLSPECSVICMQHYPHGTLGGYLKTRSHMTEVGLYKVTLDVARGLGFIHQNHLVHNALTTETIYMSSLAGKIGLRAVIGDFENSYAVSENTLRKSPLMLDRSQILDSCSLGSLYSISQQLDMDNNKFAPDIRSFGMVVLEMLMALGEFDEHSGIGIHYRNGDARRNSAYDNASLNSVDTPQTGLQKQAALTQQSAGKQRHLMGSDPNLPRRHANKDCNCSPRVTDIRAVKCRSLEATPVNFVGAIANRVESPTKEVPATGKSAFTLLKTKKVGDNCTSRPSTARDGAPATPTRRKYEAQYRNLPPLPPKNVKSPRRYRSANQKPPYNSPNHEEMSPPPTTKLALSDADTALSVSVGDASGSQSTENCDFSPSIDQDFYSLSIGSLGSFETIYEDEERGTAKGEHNTSLNRTGRSVVSKPPVLKRKMAESELLKKRYSISSANDSVFSIDSGIGSYSSDTYSELSAGMYGQRTWIDTHRGVRRLESPDINSVLLVRKKPCSKHHPAPSHHCSAALTPSETSQSCLERGCTNSCQTDSSISNSDTLSSDEPTYEIISSFKRPDFPSNLETRVQQLAPKMTQVEGMNFGDAHPAIRQQYRYAVPRLGVSAVLARRLSDVSIGSATSCTTHRSQDVPEAKDNGNAKTAKRSKSRPNSATRITTSLSSDGTPTDRDENLSSSVLSIIQDSKILLEQTSGNSNSSKLPLKAFPDSCTAPAHRNRSEAKARRLNPDHNSIAKLLDSAHLDPKEKGRLLNMLKLINGNDKLGVIGKQMITLFSKCWLEEPVPSADELFQRLNLVLPSAAV